MKFEVRERPMCARCTLNVFPFWKRIYCDAARTDSHSKHGRNGFVLFRRSDWVRFVGTIWVRSVGTIGFVPSRRLGLFRGTIGFVPSERLGLFRGTIGFVPSERLGLFRGTIGFVSSERFGFVSSGQLGSFRRDRLRGIVASRRGDRAIPAAISALLMVQGRGGPEPRPDGRADYRYHRGPMGIRSRRSGSVTQGDGGGIGASDRDRLVHTEGGRDGETSGGRIEPRR